jgi:hypothetical protein
MESAPQRIARGALVVTPQPLLAQVTALQERAFQVPKRALAGMRR